MWAARRPGDQVRVDRVVAAARREIVMRRAIVMAFGLAIVTVVALGGCGKKGQQATESASDSLLTASPVEQPAGDLTPQGQYQEPEKTPEGGKPAPASTKPKTAAKAPTPAPTRTQPTMTVPAGTGIMITVDVPVSSETAKPGDTWTGVVKEPVVIGTDAPIPAGSKVSGVVSGAAPAQKGSRAFLLVSVRSVTVNGESYDVSATADSIIAGSTRARNLGAIAGGAAAGALIGKAVGGSGKGAVIGGILGGAAATGAVAASKGYQVALKEGTELSFRIEQPVTIRK
jgi:hypothetical protein